ncbi:MAG: AAA family ATPase [Pseudomonadota bacterium]
MHRHVVISGCSGGGKSTLLAELARRGFAVVEEPGRRVVERELARGGTALPWKDVEAFVEQIYALSRADLESAPQDQWVFFDRGHIDAASALARLRDLDITALLPDPQLYNLQVFFAPPWPDVYVQDDARRHDLRDALPEYERLLGVYPRLGYELEILAKVSIAARADRVLARLGLESIERPAG